MPSTPPLEIPIKTSQRVVKSCGFCYRRKVKCDMQLPCSRCVQRGIGSLCQQESRIVNGQVTGGHQSRSERKDRRQPTLSELRKENGTLHRYIASQEKRIRVLEARLESDAPRASSSEFASPTNSSPINSSATEFNLRPHADENSSGDASDPLPGLNRSIAELSGLIDLSLPVDDVGHAPTDELVALALTIISPDTSAYLVKFHFDFLDWKHCVCHEPSFLLEHEAWCDSRKAGLPIDKPYRFLAVYFAIISCSLYFMDPTEVVFGAGVVLPEAIQELPALLCDLSMQCLKATRFMEAGSLEALQAICILTLVAYAVGRTNYMRSLIHCGIAVARSMKYDRIVEGHTPCAHIERELAKRIWTCLCIDECFGLEGMEASIVYPIVKSSPPYTMEDFEMDRSTERSGSSGLPRVSCLLCLQRVTDCIRSFVCCIANEDNVNTRFQLTCDFDQRLDSIVASFQADHERVTGLRLKQLQWFQYEINITLWTTRLLLYRPFTGRRSGGRMEESAHQKILVSARAILTARLQKVSKYTW